MSASSFGSKLNKYVEALFKSFYGKKLSSKAFTPEEVKAICKAAYSDGYDDCKAMYEGTKNEK